MPSLARHIGLIEAAERRYEKDVAAFGLPFEPGESCPRSARLGGPWSCENACSSLRRGWISPACIACRTGERTATFFVSLKCARSCYFCFNPNQEDYDRFRVETRDIARELVDAYAHGAEYDCLAITGGEPFLHPVEVFAFLICARELYPRAHTRVYTCGDGLDVQMLSELAEAGLDEIRFSVKLDEPFERREATLALIGQAVGAIPSVIVEMPVIPGTLPEMRNLLVRLDDMGVSGVNLLEFCFPLRNAEEFSGRGFLLRARPFRVAYDWWYAGGVPVAGSEAEALELLRFADERDLAMGVHYCSSDNKNTGQVYQQNVAFERDPALASRYGYLTFDKEDFFLKCATAFGPDARRLAPWLESRGVPAGRLLYEKEEGRLLFPLGCLGSASGAFPSAVLGESLFVLERDGDGERLREVGCAPAFAGGEREGALLRTGPCR